MSQSRVAEIILKYVVDNQSVAKATQANQSVRASLLDNQAALLALGNASALATREQQDLKTGFAATKREMVTASAAAMQLNNSFFEIARKQELDRVAQEFVLIRNKTNDTNAALAETARTLERIGASESEINSVAAAMQKLDASPEDKKRTSFNPQGREFLGGQTFRQVGFQLRSIPGGGITEFLGRISPIADLAAMGMDKLGGSIIKLVAITAPAIIAMGAFVFAIDTVSKVIQAGKARFASALKAQEAYYDAVRDLDSSAARELIAQKQNERDSLVLRVQENTTALENSLTVSMRELTAPVAIILDAASQLPASQIRETLNAQREALQTTNDEIARLTDAYAANGFAAGDARAAGERLREKNQEAFAETLSQEERRLAISRQILAFQESGDLDAAQKLRDSANRDEMEAQQLYNARERTALQLRAAASVSTITRDSSAEDFARYHALSDNAELLEQSLVDLNLTMADSRYTTDQLDANMQNIRDRFDELSRLDIFKSDSSITARAMAMTAEERAKYSQGLQEEINLLEQLGSAHRDSQVIQEYVTETTTELTRELEIVGTVFRSIADAASDLAIAQQAVSDQTENYFYATQQMVEANERATKATKEFADAQQKSTDKIGDIVSDAFKKSEEFRRESEKDALKSKEEFDDKIAKAQEDSNARIAKLILDASRAIEDGVANRNALAVFLAEQKLADDLADEGNRNKDDLKRTEEAYKKQQKVISDQLDEQLRKLKANADDAVAVERQRYALERSERHRAIAVARVDIQNAEEQMRVVRTQGNANRVIQEQFHQVTVTNIIASNLVNQRFLWQYHFNWLSANIPRAGSGATSVGAQVGALTTRTTFNQMFDDRFGQYQRAIRQEG